MKTESWVQTVDELEELYDEPVAAAVTKEVDQLVPLHRAFIRQSPFVVLATNGEGGLDCSPRGDPAGFVHVEDSRTLHLPDRRGNNRIDSLRNIVTDPRVALLFLIPGIGMTLRVNGTARLRRDEAIRAAHSFRGKLPATVVEVAVQTVFTQCPKALMRSKLWDPESQQSHDTVPTVGQIMDQITNGQFGGEEYDANYPAHAERTIY